MISMTLPLIATMYLDKTNQWESVGIEKRNEAIQHIQTGRLTQIYYVHRYQLLTEDHSLLGRLRLYFRGYNVIKVKWY